MLPGLAKSRSLPVIPWEFPELGRLHHDQSHLGRPIDPEVVMRVRASLNKYQGPRTLEDRMEIIMAKAAEKQRKMRATSAEYAAYLQKVKEEAVPVFKFDEDPRKGMPTQEEYIMARVKKGLREIREKTSDYKAWTEELHVKQAYKLQEKLEAKMKGDEQFAKSGAAQEEDRKKRDAAIQESVRLTQAEYWKWLGEMKKEVATRPSSAPAAVPSGVASASSLADKKRQESIREFRKNSAEYMEWLQTVNHAKFELPYHPVVDAEEHQRRLDSKMHKVKEFNKESAAYFERVRQMEEKHHRRITRVVKKRLDADKAFNRSHEEGASQLAVKMEEQKQQQLEVAMKMRQEKKDMYKRVREKPMFLELAYKTK